MAYRTGLRALALSVILTGMLGPLVAFGAAAHAGKVPITTSSEPARAAFLKGRDLAEQLRGAEARSEFERAVAADPGFAQALLGLANTQPTAVGFNEVMARAVAAADHASAGERLMILAGQAGGHGDNTEQIRLLKELVAQYPDDERAQNLYGNALFATQDWAGAIRAYEAAVRAAPSFSQPYNQLGYSYRFLGQMDRAEVTFKKYIAVSPDNPNPYDSYAELLLKLGRYDESITNYRKALKADPYFIASHIGIATDYDLLKKPQQARAELDALVAKAKDDGQRRAAMFAQTVSDAHAGDLAAAQKEMDRQYDLGIATNDTLAMIGDLVVMGTIALETGDADGAEKQFHAAAGMNAKSVTIPEANRTNQQRFQIFLAGRVALARKDVAAAQALSGRFTSEAQASGSAGQKLLTHELAGQVALAQGKWAEAIAELDKSNLQDPYNVYRLSLAYAGKGDADKARKYAADARNFNALANLNYAFVLRALNRS